MDRRKEKGIQKPKKPIYKKWWFYVVMLFVIGGLGNMFGGGSEPKADTTNQSSSVKSEKPVEKVEEVKDETPSDYKSALRSAETYSSMMNMSKRGIYDQLISEYGDKFSPEAAQYAIENISADWNANALKSAEVYQETMAMSPEAIRDQLVSEYGDKFTQEEADYAVANLS